MKKSSKDKWNLIKLSPLVTEDCDILSAVIVEANYFIIENYIGCICFFNHHYVETFTSFNINLLYSRVMLIY